MNDLDALLQCGDAARERRPMALSTLRRFVRGINEPSVLLTGASQFEDDEATAAIMLARAIALAPEDVRAREDLAALYIQQDPPARRLRTRAAIGRVLKFDPGNLFAQRLTLRALEHRRSHRKVIRLARAMIQRDPTLVEAVVVLARVLAKEGHLPAAILELRRFKERISVPDPAYAAWLTAETGEAEMHLRSATDG
jgi:cytochrome c-type biogenesis protein CcmH/NrfG